jgi:hypothetical protein
MNDQEIKKAISNINYGLHYEDCGNMVVVTKFAAHQAISALEKQIPKQPKIMETTLIGENFWWYCGHCGASRHTGSKSNYCGYCGGKVDWRNEDE